MIIPSENLGDLSTELEAFARTVPAVAEHISPPFLKMVAGGLLVGEAVAVGFASPASAHEASSRAGYVVFESGDNVTEVGEATGYTKEELLADPKNEEIKSHPNSVKPGDEMHLPEKKDSETTLFTKTHTIKPGENLNKLASKYGVLVTTLQRLNSIKNANRIIAGEKLIIPVKKPTTPTERASADKNVTTRAESTYHIKPGDTLGRIARMYGVPVTTLQRLNGIKNANYIIAGKDLKIPGNKKPEQAAHLTVNAHRVKDDETTWDFARSIGVSPDQVKKAVKFDIDKINPDQQLVFKKDDQWHIRRVLKGDTVGAIAFQEKIPPSSLKRLEDFDRELIWRDDILIAVTGQNSSPEVPKTPPEPVIPAPVPSVVEAAASPSTAPETAQNQVAFETLFNPTDEVRQLLQSKVEPVMAQQSMYEAAGQATGLDWRVLAAIDFKESGNNPSHSTFAGEHLGADNPDGLKDLPTTKLENLIAAGNFLKHKAVSVYGIELAVNSSVEDLAKAALAWNRGVMYKRVGADVTTSPYIMNGIDAAHTWMRWPAGRQEPRSTRGHRHRVPGFVPMLLTLHNIPNLQQVMPTIGTGEGLLPVAPIIETPAPVAAPPLEAPSPVPAEVPVAETNSVSVPPELTPSADQATDETKSAPEPTSDENKVTPTPDASSKTATTPVPNSADIQPAVVAAPPAEQAPAQPNHIIANESMTSPVPGMTHVTSPFGPRTSPGGIGSTNHEGVDLRAPIGTPVVAPDDGTVTYAGKAGGYGNMIEVDLGKNSKDEDVKVRVGHMNDIETTVGAEVQRGQELGHTGNTGHSTGPHAHIEERHNDQPVDPSAHVLYGETN